MSLDPRSDFDRDRIPPKHDANWTLGFSRPGSFQEPQAKATRHVDFESRSTIIDEGDEAKSVFLITEGAVMLSKLLPDGRRQIIELLGPGDVFGLTCTRVHDASAETLSPTRIVAYDRRHLDESPALQQLMHDRMRSQICALHDHAVLLGRKSAAERVATFLMRLLPGRGGVDCIGGGKKDEARVRVPLTRQEIADYLGLTLETVSRAFSQLKRDGILAYGRNNEVSITNVCRLCHRTGAH
jgi:CRP-like cAMP-binding protein